MCDTLGRVVNGGLALFAKNSDRSPNEPQVIEYRPARDHREKALPTTYLTVEQTPHTFATLLSRPAWMWGAEMGVNEHGVCIGNEAVFTRGRYARTGLTGMDLVRLALERASDGQQAVQVILELLERYGQGGDCGYDHAFFYDNAFLILDRREVWLLETAGKQWVTRRVSADSISNRLSIGAEGDEYSTGAPFDFARRFREPVYSRFSGSKERLAQTAPRAASAESVADMMAALRVHRTGAAPLERGDVASVCMHAGGLVGDHTTSSMVVELGKDITVWVTGSSTPCLSLFVPWEFGAEPEAPVFPAGRADEAAGWWRQRERFARAWVGRTPPEEFYARRDALERSWLALPAGPQRTRRAREEAERFQNEWAAAAGAPPRRGSGRFLRYWEKKDRALARPERPVAGGG